jgi:hypothetical protein
LISRRLRLSKGNKGRIEKKKGRIEKKKEGSKGIKDAVGIRLSSA